MTIKTLLEFDTTDGEKPPPYEEVNEFFEQHNTGSVSTIYPGLVCLIDELNNCCVRYRGKLLEHNDDHGQWYEATVIVENDITHTIHNRDKF